MVAGAGCDVSGFAVWLDAAIESWISLHQLSCVHREHSLLLLFPLLPESSLGVLAAFERRVPSTCEDMVESGSSPPPGSAQHGKLRGVEARNHRLERRFRWVVPSVRRREGATTLPVRLGGADCSSPAPQARRVNKGCI